jgi:DUF4097 and DUF4098 domain-containing protein YvlB
VRPATISRHGFRLILIALLSSLTGCGSATDRTLEEIFEQSYAIEPTANVTIRNGDGAIFVYGSPANEIRVRAIKKAYTYERLKQIVINVSAQPGSVSIETIFSPKQTWGFFDRSGTVDYTIVVPQTANISRLELDNGEVLVDGMHGQTIHARLGSGQMFEHNCFSDATFLVGRGTLALTYEWWEQSKFSIRADIAHGNALAYLPSDAAFHLTAEAVDGKIANDFAEQDERSAEGISKVDTLVRNGGDVTIKMHVTEGNIKIVEANP